MVGASGAGEGWEKRGFKGRLILGPMGGSNLSSLIRFFKSHIHSSATLSATLFGIVHHSPKLLVGSWNSLRFISDIWGRHVEVCTTHLVPVCVLGLFLPFLPPAGLSTLSTVELPLHLRRHRHLSTITRTHKHLNINEIQKQNMQTRRQGSPKI